MRIPSAGSPQRRRARALPALLLVLALLLSGCVSTAGGVSGSLGRALEQCGSATASAAIAIRQVAAGQVTAAVNATVFQDALQEVQQAAGQVNQADAETDVQRRQRDAARTLIERAETALIAGREATSDRDTSAIAASTKSLNAVTAALQAKAKELKP